MERKNFCSGCGCTFIAGQVFTSLNLCSYKAWNIVNFEFLDCSLVGVEMVPFFLTDVTTILYHRVCV